MVQLDLKILQQLRIIVNCTRNSQNINTMYTIFFLMYQHNISDYLYLYLYIMYAITTVIDK